MATSPTICAALDTFQQAANRGTAVHLSPELVQELRDALQAKPEGPATPSGYAYRYNNHFGGTYIKFNGGGEVNGSRPIEAVPYWFTPPSVPTAPPTPETPAEALAARPLLEQVAALADCIGAWTVGQITAISNRAAAWLQQNPPGQPVAIEPRGCPTPGACSCVEPASPAPEQGDAWWHELINEIARVQHVAQGEGQGPRFDLAKAVELSRRPTPPAPEPGELGELVELLKLAGRWATSTGVHLNRFAALFDQQATELAALREVSVALSEWEDAFMGGVCAALATVTAHGNSVIWREIVRSVGIDNALNYAANVNPEDWDLAGFSKYAQSELGKDKPQPAPQAGEGEA